MIRNTIAIAMLLSLLVAAYGCSSAPRMAVPGGGMYDSSELKAFVEETGPIPEPLPEYRITIGDRLNVVFMYHKNLTTNDLLVRSDGRISLPYVGDQVAMGLTPMELDSVLTDQFSEILKDPSLSVILSAPATQQVYVLGMVKQPGAFEYASHISVLQAVARAAGFDKGAKPEHAVIIRRTSFERIVGIEIDLERIMEGKDIHSDIPLRNYDIVYIPQSRLSSIADFASTVNEIVSLPLDVALQGWQIRNLQASYDFFRDREAE